MCSSILRQRQRLAGKWRALRQLQKRIVGANVLYLLLLVVYCLIWRFDVLRYIILLSGVALAAAVPELIGKNEPVSQRDRDLRVVLLCIPAIAIAIVQILSDRDNDAKQVSLSRQLETLQLVKIRDQIRETEGDQREGVDLDPRDTIDAIKNSDMGFLAKADMLALHSAARQVDLAKAEPSLAARLPPISSDAKSRLDAYSALGTSLSGIATKPSEAQIAVNEIVRLINSEDSYRTAAETFASKVGPLYKEFTEQNSGGRDFKEMRANVWTLYGQVHSLIGEYDLAGVSNHLGTLAMASGHKEQALSLFYRGFESDHEHLPIYESLGYYLWSANDDPATALTYATLGLAEANALKEALNAESKAITPDEHGAVLIEEVPKWTAFIDGMIVRFKLQYAYFSALEIAPQNEMSARRYARELLNSNKDDAEFQDALGFVLLRYGSPAELDEADKLFQLATENPSGERLTARLADQHRRELDRFRRSLHLAQ